MRMHFLNLFAVLAWACLLDAFAVPASSAASGGAPDYQSPYYAVGLARDASAFTLFSVDALGQGKLAQNPAIGDLAASSSALRFQAEVPGKFAYRAVKSDGKAVNSWHITCEDKVFTLCSEFAPGAPAEPFVLEFNQRLNHATLLGMMKPGERRMTLPCVLHLPDMGSLRITGSAPGLTLDYDARRRRVPVNFVRVAFPPATAGHPRIEYRLEVAAIYPKLAGIEGNPLYDGFRRSFLNIFQVNPRVQMLANNASSDPVTFAVYPYALVAREAPPLAEGLTCLDLVRMTLDRYLAGARGYGQVGYSSAGTDADIAEWGTPYNALDAYPSLLIAACTYVDAAHDRAWGRANYAKLAAWGREMMAADKDGNDLIEYPTTGNLGDRPNRKRRPANWWDTINFGHEDAYSNALAFKACEMMADLARTLGRTDDAAFFKDKAARLRGAYVPTFLNPASGVLAGWKSADGQLHDYWFTFVNGVAITYGLVDGKTANSIMDRLLAKMKAVGFTRFDLGLPGNLVPVRRGDYVDQPDPPERFGVPRLEDGSDGFQFYENGGATGCYAYFTIKALYKLGRVEDARRIFHPMLQGYAAGNFQGFGENGLSKDWRDWQGGCHGYEGLLVENYLALLAVLEDVK